MLKGLTITPTQLGRISIGGTEKKGEKFLPKKSDEITITGNNQENRQWGPHPVDAELRKGMATGAKLRSIPVRIMFDEVENNFRAVYTCFDQKGRQLCVGNGEKAKRRADSSVKDEVCPGPDYCAFGKENRCKLFGRAMFGIEGLWDKNPLAGFMFRTTSWNSVKQIFAQLHYFHALTGGKMAGMRCNLRMRVKTSAASMRSAFYYLDLEPAGDLVEIVKETLALHKTWEEAGVDRPNLEKAVREGIENSMFTEDDVDGEQIAVEFGMAKGMQVVDPETGEIMAEGTADPVINGQQKIEIMSLMEEVELPLSRLNAFLQRDPVSPLETITVPQYERIKLSIRRQDSAQVNGAATNSAEPPQPVTNSGQTTVKASFDF